MDTITIKYEDNASLCYNKEKYVERLSKVHSEKSTTGALQISKSFTVKTKLRIWKAVVVDPEPSAATTS